MIQTTTCNWFSSQARRIDVADGDTLSFDECLRVPAVGALTPLPQSGVAQIAVDGSLAVELDVSALTLPFGAPQAIGGAPVDPAAQSGGIDGRPILSLWAFAPFGAYGDGIRVSFDGPVPQLASAPGTVRNLQFWDVDKDSGEFAVVGTGSVDDAGVVTILGEVRPHALTWLYVTEA